MAPSKKNDDGKKKEADGKKRNNENKKKGAVGRKKAESNSSLPKRKTRSQVQEGASPVFSTFPDEAREQRKAWEDHGIRPDSKRAPDGNDAEKGRPDKRPKRNPAPEKATAVKKAPASKKGSVAKKGPVTAKPIAKKTPKGPSKNAAPKAPTEESPEKSGENQAEDDHASEDAQSDAPSDSEQTTIAPQPSATTPSAGPVSAVTQPQNGSSSTIPTTSPTTVPATTPAPAPNEVTPPKSIRKIAAIPDPGCAGPSTSQNTLKPSGSSQPTQISGTDCTAASKGASSNGVVSNSNGKRPLEGKKTHSNGATQAPKSSKKGKGPAQDQAPAQTSGDPCDDFARRLRDWQAQETARGTPSAAEQPARWNRYLEDETVMRAIYAVTEAVSDNDGEVQYAIARFDTFIGDAINNSAPQPMLGDLARRGRPALFPFTSNRAFGGMLHITLIELRPGNVATDPFRIEHHDSLIPDYSDEEPRTLEQMAPGHSQARRSQLTERAITVLDGMGWGLDGNATIEDSVRPTATPMRQARGWDCGLHTIIDAWAIALGLRINSEGVSETRVTAFLQHALLLVNLAVQGLMDSKTIEAFLRCYRLVAANIPAPANRQFRNTLPLLNNTDINNRITRVRLEDALTVERQNDPEVPRLDSVLDRIEARIDDVGYWTVERLLQELRFRREAQPTPDRANAIRSPETLNTADRATMQDSNLSPRSFRAARDLQRELDRQRNPEPTSPTPQRANTSDSATMPAVTAAPEAALGTNAPVIQGNFDTSGSFPSASAATQDRSPQKSQVEVQGATQDQILSEPQIEADDSPADQSDDLWVSDDNDGVPSDLFEDGTMDTDIEDGPPSATLPTTPSGIVLPATPRATILLNNGEICGDQDLSPAFPRPTPPQQSAPPAAVMVSPTTDQNPLIGQEKDGEDALAPLDQTGLSPSADEDDIADESTLIEQGDQTMGEEELAADQTRDAASDDEDEMDLDETLLEGELSYTENNQDEVNEDRSDEEEEEEEVEAGQWAGGSRGFNTSAPAPRYPLPAPSTRGQPVTPPSAPVEPRTESEEAFAEMYQAMGK